MPSAPRNPLLLPLIVAGALFMEMLDSTIIVTALPRMAESLGSTPVELSLALTAYLITLAVFLPASGWMADRFGARRVFLAAIGLFTLASLLCGLSGSLWQLVAARVLQGIGSAMMSPVGRLIVLRRTGKTDLVRAINFMTFPGLVGLVLGPPLGGFLTTFASWRLNFFINLPIGLVGMGLVAALVKPEAPGPQRPFDHQGFLLNGGALACLMVGVDRLGTGIFGWESRAWLAAILVLGALALRHARQAEHPLLDLAAYRIPTFRVANTGGMAFRLSIATTNLLLPLFFQLGLGMSPLAAGVQLLGHAAGDVLIKTVTTQTLRQVGFRTMLIASASLYGISMAGCILLTGSTPAWAIMTLMLASGALRSLQMTALSALQFADIEPAMLTDASTLSNVLQQVPRALGIALAAVVLNAAAAFRAGGPSHLAIPDFQVGFAVTALLALASLAWYLPLDRGTAAEVSGHRLGHINRI